jgi:hypothetical protein
MSRSRAFLKATRLTHLYLGVFISPALIFFAFTGALQTFSLHETTRGSSYKPPAWAITLGQIHKKQSPVVPVRRTPPPDARPDARPAGKDHDPSQSQAQSKGQPAPGAESPQQAATPATPAPRAHHPLPLKIFFLIVSIGLFLSTLSGLYMSYKYIHSKRLITATLIAGTIIPIALTFV